jgi:putative N-acetyltransferase (TIGR04045 family)
MVCLDKELDCATDWIPNEFLIRQVCQDWELSGARALRRAVFCFEQGLFDKDDRDTVDDHCTHLVAMSCNAGMPEQVIGTVRIHEVAPGLWWGSRLAVHPTFRSQGHIGITLIKLAVSRAKALGCQKFMAHVQAQNAELFKKLHWTEHAQLSIHGRAHLEMSADLNAYPACHDPISGFVTRSKVLS